MGQQIRHILAVVANETLEKLAFIFAFADDERVNDGPALAMTGRVDFNGYFSGALMIENRFLLLIWNGHIVQALEIKTGRIGEEAFGLIPESDVYFWLMIPSGADQSNLPGPPGCAAGSAPFCARSRLSARSVRRAAGSPAAWQRLARIGTTAGRHPATTHRR